MGRHRAMARVLALLLALAAPAGAAAADVYVDPAVAEQGDGTALYPLRSLGDARIVSGNRYLLRRGRTYPAGIEVGGVENVTIGAWGEGPPPLVDGRGAAPYGVRVYSSRDVTVEGLEIKGVAGACVLLLGSADYLVRDNHLHHALYGVAVNAGRLGPRGLIERNRIHHTIGDGIGAWNLPAGPVIRLNHIHDFGNDGIDVLGSTGAVIDGNTIHDSFDHAVLDGRGTTHAGIKAGGNRGRGGGRNIVLGNTVYGVKNFGIWNRGAIGNVYRGNTCYRNGVNFSFVSSEGPSRAVVVDNVAREPSFAAGLRYSVAMPAAGELAGASGNLWEGGLVRVGDAGVISDERRYRELMAPLEADARF